MGRLKLLSLALMLAAAPATLATAADPASEQAAIALTQKLIAFRSVSGDGNQTPEEAAYLKSVLVAGGFDEADVEVVPLAGTAYLIARYRGTDPAAKPMVISGHMDVVEAKPEDWERDPFTGIIENGYLFGRGATDMKTDLALAVTSLLDMKRAGVKPRRDIILALSGDEETAMATTMQLAQRLKDAEMVLNIDGGGGQLDEAGKPQLFTINGAEKTYADFRLTVTNPGGHSSAPRRDNAINQLAAALVRIGAYRFTPQMNDVTRAYFIGAADHERPDIAAAMRAFVKDPTDQAAIETLAADPAYVGQIGTTCVATMLSGGHAQNALPQRASANINCRIFPGTKPAEVMAILKQVADEPGLVIEDVSEGVTASDASPLRPDVMAAVRRAIGLHYRGVPVFPAMAAGASDNMWFRAQGVPSYGVSPIFIKESDDFSHGLNERVPIANIQPGLDYYRALFTDLSK